MKKLPAIEQRSYRPRLSRAHIDVLLEMVAVGKKREWQSMSTDSRNALNESIKILKTVPRTIDKRW